MRSATFKPREFKGRHMLAIMISFFGVIIGVNLTMAYFANSTWSGLVVANGYVASQSFDEDKARAMAQDALGWKIDLAHAPQQVTLAFADRSGAPIAGLAMTGTLRRPTTDRNAQALVFAQAQPGVYEAPAALAPGIWEVDVKASRDDGLAYAKTFRFVVK